MGFFDRFKKKTAAPDPAPAPRPEPVVPEPEPKPEPEPAPPKKINTYTEIQLENTKVCKDALKDIAVIYNILDGDKHEITWDEALHLYYSDTKYYFPWEFNVKECKIEKSDTGFSVFGDGLHLGDIKKSKFEGSPFHTISELMSCNGIDRIECKIKNRSDYFNITKQEYNNTPGFEPKKDDPHNRGTNEWFDMNDPRIVLKVFFDPALLGLQEEIPDPEELGLL